MLDADAHWLAIPLDQPGFIARLLLRAEALVKICVRHEPPSPQFCDRAIDGFNQHSIPLSLRLKLLAVLPQYTDLILAFKIKQRGDGTQRHTQLSMEQDPLQPKQLLAPVVAIAICTYTAWCQQPDLV